METKNSINSIIMDETTDVIEIDQRSLLEVYDKKHRYGKNLRYYYKEWQNIYVSNESDLKIFFSWLDSPECPDLDICSRKDLEEDIVEYLNTDEERLPFKIDINANDGLFYQQDCNTPLTTGTDGWIFVLNNFQLFAHEKITETSPRFHHSSFFAGKPVQFAGLFVCTTGRIETLFPHSGHYRPTEHHLYSLLLHLETKLPRNLFEEIKVDAQRVVKISRSNHDEGSLQNVVVTTRTKKKKRKICCQYLVEAPFLISFLRVKHKSWQLNGMFGELHDSLRSMGIQTEEDVLDDVEAEEGQHGKQSTAALSAHYNNSYNNEINNSDISNNSSISEKSLSCHDNTINRRDNAQLTTYPNSNNINNNNINNKNISNNYDRTPPHCDNVTPPPPPHHYQWNSPYNSPPHTRWNRLFDFSV